MLWNVDDNCQETSGSVYVMSLGFSYKMTPVTPLHVNSLQRYCMSKNGYDLDVLSGKPQKFIICRQCSQLKNVTNWTSISIFSEVMNKFYFFDLWETLTFDFWPPKSNQCYFGWEAQFWLRKCIIFIKIIVGFLSQKHTRKHSYSYILLSFYYYLNSEISLTWNKNKLHTIAFFSQQSTKL